MSERKRSSQRFGYLCYWRSQGGLLESLIRPMQRRARMTGLLSAGAPPGSASCFALKEPVITFVPKISRSVRVNPLFKYEHAARPEAVNTVSATPIFFNADNWSNADTLQRDAPIAVLVIDFLEDIRYLLQEPEIEDRLATYAQLCGEYLRGSIAANFPSFVKTHTEPSELLELADTGFFISTRKTRLLFQDDESRLLIERVEERRKEMPSRP
jgi:hypothetical protein